jgi:hypothetical protein
MNVINAIISRPYPGHAQTVTYYDQEGIERAAYTGARIGDTDQTVTEYMRQNPGFEIVSIAECMRLTHIALIEMCDDWKEVSADDYHRALECLPPCRWTHGDDWEIFHMVERLTGPLVAWYARRGPREGGKYYSRTQFEDQKIDVLIATLPPAESSACG